MAHYISLFVRAVFVENMAVQCRKILIEDHLEDLHQRGDHSDKGDEVKKAEIHPLNQRAVAQHQVIVSGTVQRAGHLPAADCG